jgi:hypothetical protein
MPVKRHSCHIAYSPLGGPGANLLREPNDDRAEECSKSVARRDWRKNVTVRIS